MRTKDEAYTIPGFNERMNEAFNNSDLSIADICRRTNMERSTFYNYLGGSLPNSFNLMKLAKALCVSTDWLLGLKEGKGIYE